MVQSSHLLPFRFGSNLGENLSHGPLQAAQTRALALLHPTSWLYH